MCVCACLWLCAWRNGFNDLNDLHEYIDLRYFLQMQMVWLQLESHNDDVAKSQSETQAEKEKLLNAQVGYYI